MGKRKEYSIQNPRLQAFTDRFRELVDLQGGVSKISELTGISRPTINFWYNGQRTPDAENLIIISEKLNVSIDWLLGRLPYGNKSNEEKLRQVSELTGLSNTSIFQLERISTVYMGKQAVDAFISSPCFYQAASYLSTYFFGTWLEEFTGKDEGLISTLKPLKDKNFYERYVQPAMLSKISECLIETKKQLDMKSD